MQDEEKNNNDTEFVKDEEIVAEEILSDKLKKLREDLKTCEAQKGEYLAGWQRAKADSINARRDEDKARMEFVKYSAENVLRETLAVADSLLARKSFGEGGDDPIYNQLLEILKREGVMPIDAKDKKFDPMYHEALEQVEVSEKEKDGVIMEELQKGYMIYDRVLRPAKVKVGVLKNTI